MFLNKFITFIKKFTNRVINILLILIVIGLISSIIYSSIIVYLSNRIYGPLIDKIGDLQYQIVTPYMDFQTMIGKEINIDAVKNIKLNLDKAENTRKYIINVISKPIISFFMPDSIENNLWQLNNLYNDFIVIFNGKLSDYQQNNTSHLNDSKFSKLLYDFRDLDDSCLDDIELLNVFQLNLFEGFQLISIISILICGILIIIYYRYTIKRHTNDIIEINNNYIKLNYEYMKLVNSGKKLKASNRRHSAHK
jgi:hypothetical protein